VASNSGVVPALYTIGHSTRSAEAFVELLRAHGIGGIADVRRHPGSRRHPQFGKDVLAQALPAAGIGYAWYEALGGRRSRPKDAPPSAWRVPAFAAYADYMNSEAFRAAMTALLESAARTAVAVMCAEAVPYSCHRRLISDWAELHGVPVTHLMTAARSERHQVTAFARNVEGRIVYEAQAQLSLKLPSDLPR
jgi:uncharacterized protein (DUF488 family)